jgi:glutathione S-transferase
VIEVSAFRWVPPFAQGLVRDLRVRWALQESGQSYKSMLIGPDDQKSEAYRALQPFGQVPIYKEDGFSMFESGAIVLHIAEKSDVLMPRDAKARLRATTWMFAALNSIEPHVQNLVVLDAFYANEAWAKQRRPGARALAESRLSALSGRLAGRDYLDDRFTAADLLMTTVLRTLRDDDLIGQFPALRDYRERCEARPAFRKALTAQMADFAEMAPAAG